MSSFLSFFLLRARGVSGFFLSTFVVSPRPLAKSRQLTIFPLGQRESLVRELVLSLAMAGRERDALDELELCGSLIFSYVLLHTTTPTLTI